MFAQKKAAPPARVPLQNQKPDEIKVYLSTLDVANIGYLRPLLLSPNTTALIMRLRMSMTLSSFSVAVSAVIVPAAVKMANEISAQ